MERVAVIFDNFEDAMDVHRKLFEMLRKNGYVSYRDFNNIINSANEKIENDMYDMNGWFYLCEVAVEPYKDDEWIIEMPKMVNLI